MARSTEVKPKKNQQPAEAHVPSWQRDSVDRSLRNARARAQARSDRFVAAAIELLGERDESDFTIQDVVDRSNMSQRTFYTFFDGKDSLRCGSKRCWKRYRRSPRCRPGWLVGSASCTCG